MMRASIICAKAPGTFSQIIDQSFSVSLLTRGVEEGRERLLQKPLLLHLRLLFYGNRINKAVTSMTNPNKARGFLHEWLNARRWAKNIHNAASFVRKSSSCVMSATPTKTKDRRSNKQQLQILWSKRYICRRKSIIWKIFTVGQRRKCRADFSWVLRLDWVLH